MKIDNVKQCVASAGGNDDFRHENKRLLKCWDSKYTGNNWR